MHHSLLNQVLLLALGIGSLQVFFPNTAAAIISDHSLSSPRQRPSSPISSSYTASKSGVSDSHGLHRRRGPFKREEPDIYYCIPLGTSMIQGYNYYKQRDHPPSGSYTFQAVVERTKTRQVYDTLNGNQHFVLIVRSDRRLLDDIAPIENLKLPPIAVPERKMYTDMIMNDVEHFETGQGSAVAFPGITLHYWLGQKGLVGFEDMGEALKNIVDGLLLLSVNKVILPYLTPGDIIQQLTGNVGHDQVVYKLLSIDNGINLPEEPNFKEIFKGIRNKIDKGTSDDIFKAPGE